MSSKESILMRPKATHRVLEREERKVVIYFKDHQWHYEFTGRWTAQLLLKVAKGLRRGLRRQRMAGVDRSALRKKSTHKPMVIPAKREGEDLGTNPVAEVRPIQMGQPEMPLVPGIKPPMVAPLEVPDAASMQPHQQTKKEEK